MLTQKKLINEVADQTGCTLKEATHSVKVVLNTVKNEIATGGEVHFNGLLNVKRQKRKARIYKTGDTVIEKPDHERPVIKLSLGLAKEATKALS